MAEFYRLPVGSIVHVLSKALSLRDDLFESWEAKLTTKEVFLPVDEVHSVALPSFFRTGNWLSINFTGDNRENIVRMVFPRSVLHYMER